jgi:copper chaperone CopZ
MDPRVKPEDDYKKSMIKKIFKIAGMHCSGCAFLVEDELAAIGIKAKASYQKGEVETEFDEKKVTEKDIARAVKKAGYKIMPLK